MIIDACELAIDAYELQCNQQSHEALKLLDQALAICPGYHRAMLLKGVIHLALGEYERGWPLYEYRNQWVTGWKGEYTESIILIDDQGYGDFIQFARYIPLVKERC